MALSCPNHNLPEYKLLETTLGKEATYAIFMANNEVLPSLEKAQKIIELYNLKKEYGGKEVREKISEISEDLNKLEGSKITSIIDDFFTSMLSSVKKIEKSENYKQLKDLFTTEQGVSSYKTLSQLLNDVRKLESNVKNDYLKARALATAMVQIDYFLDLLEKNIEVLITDTEDAKNTIPILETHLYLIGDWKAFIERNRNVLRDNPQMIKLINQIEGKIKFLETDVYKNEKLGLTQVFQDILLPKTEEYRKVIENQLVTHRRLLERAIKNNDKRLELEQKAIIDQYEATLRQFDFSNQERIMDFLEGKTGDTNAFSAFLESFRDNPSPIVSGFFKFYKTVRDKIASSSYFFERELTNELKPLLQYGERLDAEKLGEKLTFIDKRKYRNGDDYEVFTLLNPWQDYNRVIGDYLNKIEGLEDAVNEGRDIDANTERLKELRKEFSIWQNKYMFRENSAEYYKKYELWDDPIGQSLKDKIDHAYREINFIRIPELNFGQELSPEEYAAIDEWLKYIRHLGNVNNLDGTPKEGKALEEALRMKEIRKLNNELHEWKDNIPAYEKAKQRHSEYLIAIKGLAEDSLEYEDEMDKWITDNTRTVISDEFYKIRQAKIDEISIILQKLKRDSDITANIDELYEEMTSLVYGFRDEDNQPVGTLIQEKGAERIKAAQENIEKLKEKLASISGLTPEEQNRLSTLFEIRNTGTISLEEQDELNDLLSKSKAEGLNERQKKRLFELFEEIQELQSRIPTEYYIDTFNNLSSKYGVTIDSSGLINGITPILQSPELQELLKHEDFKTWFDLNHIEVKKFNPETKQREAQWERTYQWSRVVPNDNKYFQIRPSQKYSYRVVKDKYKTGYNPKTKQVELIVGKHIDNRGNFLPKTIQDGAADNTYYNKEYYRLKNSDEEEDKRLSKILDTLTEAHLKAQEGLSDTNKLWLDVPRVRKNSSEKNIRLLKLAKDKPLSIPKYFIDRIKAKWEEVEEFQSDEGNYTQEALEKVFTDKEGNQTISIPIKYTSSLPKEEVSLDIQKSILQYYYSAQTNRQLVEIHPFANSLRRILNAPENKPLDLNKKIISGKASEILKAFGISATIDAANKIPSFLRNKVFPKKAGKSNIAMAVESIIDRHFAGVNKRYLFGDNALGRNIDRALQAVGSLISLAFIKFSLPSHIVNKYSGDVQNFINSSDGYISFKDYSYAKIYLLNKWESIWIADNVRDDLTLSVQSQLTDIFEPFMGSLISDELGKRISNPPLKKILELKWISGIRELGEIDVQGTMFLAHLHATKVTQDTPNGQITIPLYEAYELDNNGIIKLKEGVDKSWNLKDGKKFLDLKERIQITNGDINGKYGSIDKSDLESHSAFTLYFKFKRFFIGMLMNRYAASNIKFSTNPKRVLIGTALAAPVVIAGFPTVGFAIGFAVGSGLTATPRFNSSISKKFGYWTSSLNSVTNLINSRFESWETLTQEEKVNLLKSAKNLTMLLLLKQLAIIAVMQFDPDDEDRYKKEKSWWYWQTVYHLLRLYVELTTFESITQYWDFILKPIAGRWMDMWKELIIAIPGTIRGDKEDKDAYYQTNYGVHKKGDSKLGTKVRRLIGIEKMKQAAEDPKTMLREYERSVKVD